MPCAFTTRCERRHSLTSSCGPFRRKVLRLFLIIDRIHSEMEKRGIPLATPQAEHGLALRGRFCSSPLQ